MGAAHALVRLAASAGEVAQVSVFESDAQVGGRIRTEQFQGATVDLGAESLLARSPETWTLLSELGLEGQAVEPGTTSASIWTGKRMVPIPKGSALGIPPHPWSFEVARAIGLPGALRAGLEPWLQHRVPDPDGPLGPFLRDRVGAAVFNRLVDPLLGGVYAGSARQLSIGAVAPQLLQAMDRNDSLLRGLRRVQPPASNPTARPSFITLREGLAQLPTALARALPSGSLRLSSRVTRLLPSPGGGVKLALTGLAPEEFDGVAIAIPAPQAADLVSDLSGDLELELRRQEWSSVATVTFSYPEQRFTTPPTGSGFLVARSGHRVVTACTFMDRKWPHLKRPDRILIRVSVGCAGDEGLLGMDDTTIISAAHDSLRRIVPIDGLPEHALVKRWQPALPQYRAGQLAWRRRVDGIAAGLPNRVVLAGAAYDGVGIPACLQRAKSVADRLWEQTRAAITASNLPAVDSCDSPDKGAPE